MPPRRRAAPVLDVDVLRAGLAAGRLVRVSIAPSGQFPDGATGRVKSIGDPATDGDEYLQIEVGSGSAKDVLPFAPGDLLPYSRSRAAAPTAAVEKPSRTPAANPPRAHRATGERRTVPPAVSPAVPAQAEDVPPDNEALFDTGAPAPAAGPRVRRPSAAASAGPAPRGRRPVVTITVASDDQGSWTVQAKVGAKPTVRSRPVSPARVAEIARQLGEPALIAAVDRLLDDNRRVVQAKAEALAAELARVQAELDSYLG